MQWPYPSVCLSVYVCSSVADDMYEVIRYMAAPAGSEWELLISSPIHLFCVQMMNCWPRIDA